MNIEYAAAERSDAPILVEIYNSAFYSDFMKYGECPAYGRSVKDMEKSILNFPKQIVKVNGKPVGVISWENQGDGVFYIGCLCVAAEYQGRGIGTAAMNHFLFDSDWNEVRLITPADNERNISFYTKRCGFTVGEECMDGNVRVVTLTKTRKTKE